MHRVFGLLTLFIFMPSLVWASVAGEVNKGNDLYRQGKFDDSLKLYQEALDQDDKSSVVKYDLGTALYKKGDYTQALGYLEQAAQNENVKIKPKVEYNLGNVLYKSGVQKENTNVDGAIKNLQEALGQYVQSVRDDPNDVDAKFNGDFVKKEIERLKQKKQKQQQQNKQNQQSQQNQQNQQNQQEKQKSSPESQALPRQQAGQKQQNTQAQAEQNQKELDRKQAEDLLEEYQDNEEPKKLLNYMPQKIDNRPVLKDW